VGRGVLGGGGVWFGGGGCCFVVEFEHLCQKSDDRNFRTHKGGRAINRNNSLEEEVELSKLGKTFAFLPEGREKKFLWVRGSMVNQLFTSDAAKRKQAGYGEKTPVNVRRQPRDWRHRW